MKVTVRIHTAHGLEFKTVKVTKKGNLKLRKPKGDDPGWKAHLADYETKHLWFGRAKHYADVYEDATETWKYDTSIPAAQQPKWTKEESASLINKKILDKAGEEMKDKSPNMMFFLLFIIGLANVAITILMVSGRLRI